MAKTQQTIDGDSVLVPADAVAKALVAAQQQENDAESGEDEISAILARLGSDSKSHVRLYREMRGGKLEFLDKFSPAEWLALDVDGVKDNYGPGDYRIRVYDENSKVRGNRGFSIARPLVSATPTPALPVASPASPEHIATVVANAVALSLAPILERIAASGNSRSEFLQELTHYKNLFAPPAASALPVPVTTSASDPLDMLRKVLDISKDLKGDGAEKTVADVFLELVQQFGPVLSERMQQMKAAGGAADAAPQARGIVPGPDVPVQLPANPAPAVTALEKEAENSMLYSISFLVAQAEMKKDPQLYAEVVLDQLPPDWIDKALTMSDDELLAMLAKLDARVTQHADWFKALHAEMKELTTEEQPSINVVPGGETTT